MERVVGWSSPLRSPAPIPSLDAIDKEIEVKLIADPPGLAENDIDVQLTDRTLMISGEKKEEIDQEQIASCFKNGVLTVRLPKKPEAQHPARKIEVKAAV